MNSAKETVLNCITVDDEPFALRLLRDDLGKIPFIKLIATCSSAQEAEVLLKKEKIDLMFLDIQMPKMKGTELLRNLSDPPMVIMTTAYEQYALEGFELNVIDYLVKPFPFERLEKATLKALELHKLKQAVVKKSEEGFLFVYSEYKEIRISWNDILYVEGLKDYVKIFLKDQPKAILTRMNLKAMEAKLPATMFCRIHNSFIVSMAKIDSTQKSQIHIGKTTIPVGEKFASEFRVRYERSDKV